MPSIKYRDGQNFPAVSVKVGDTLPVGTELDYDGDTIPLGYEQVADGDLIVSSTEPQGNDRRKVWLRHNLKNMFSLDKRIYTSQAPSSVVVTLSSGTLSASISSGSAHSAYSFNNLVVGNSYTISWKNATGLNSVQAGNGNGEIGTQYFRNYNATGSETIVATSTTLFLILLSSGTSLTITDLQVETGTEATSYEAPIEDKTYILNDNNLYEEYNDNKPVVLWENSSPNNSFASQTINLNDSLLNYEYYEVIYNRTNGDYSLSSGKIPTNRNAMLSVFRSYGFIRGVNITTNTTLTIGEATRYDSYGGSSTSVDNNYCIPEKIIGYK